MNSVLVIDPDHSIRQTLSDFCMEWSLHYFGTPHLSEGRNFLSDRKVDLIFVDLFMPEKNGLAFLDEVSSQKFPSSVIATYFPRQAPRVNIEKFTRLLGVSVTLQKPFDPRTLQWAVQDLFPFVDKPGRQKMFHHQFH